VPKIKKRDFVGIAFLLCLLLASTVSLRIDAAELKFEPYILETIDQHRITAEFARLTVPERHGKPAGNEINLAIVCVKSTTSNPGPPVVYLAGGPGGSGIALARGPRSSVILAMREVADVICFDQRGTGLSQPDVVCRERLEYPLDHVGERGALLASYEKALKRCAERLREDGIDLAAYNTEENADDLDTLREALGADKLSLLGSSYGTHLGLAFLRRHGDKVHRAILAGVEGPDHTLKLPKNIQDDLLHVSELARQERVSRKVPDLMALIAINLKRLETAPVTVSVKDPETQQIRSVTIGKFDLQQTTLGLLGTREGKTSIPALYYSLSVSNFSAPAVQAMARDILEQRTGPIGTAMGFAMDCASGASSARRQTIEQQTAQSLIGGDIDFPIPQLCEGCGLRELPDAFRAPFQCDVSTLFISGSLDGRTPPSNAEEVRRGFSQSQHVIIEGAGHGNELFTSSAEIKALMLEFMKSGRVTKDRIELPEFKFKELPNPTAR
jgi:pimeloyl-ACP methyl ester carboxylesterase